ncbi:putative disease resistance protein At3g14460 [Malus sylvestris]|uniref:putative disease resistance protein At3g14460 n=1 Tax=Malus sylvestris TaxID=3752 RepID=UPI0021AD1D3E|nr:putative disease resistance protein At3g14460 [Malus sylvestris]XP_050140345.1 putative disease resistance protein At3g14460 [Malus sylvestris]XP_050140346.1 putative disease resistance protein At3g14460 [Malus sylvestris]XP_050140347.1 putative disease resistance protein At3g14460 [Malus sylvestris]XP_050140348.1 putative disease resistance protein At3g14460 [Malus sylvestris]XP_050140350.1 putative disease resistance protein At3g14460 [Malus sylvestris]XP_050140351.1 putative disease res
MNGRIEDLFNKLEHLAKQKDNLGLRGGVGGNVSQRTPTTSVVEDGFCTYGRDGDKEKLKALLLLFDNESISNFSAVPIVGMGGVGKTTLAQLLYNDEQVKEHFDTNAWVCVSEQYEGLRVIKTLIEEITKKPCDNLEMNSLEVQLREQLRGKRFLLVLDDLWNENYDDWERLRILFTYGAKGSKVIVTTRSRRVASIVHNTISIHDLEKLSDEDCWLLLAKHAFRNENPDAHPDSVEIGKQIARKCNGLPLAAKTLGGLLSCNLDYKEWNHILNSNLWDLHANSVLPSLRLSYHYLPTYLKRCFAYCSIFPKDYEFEKENVILLWMAEGLIPHAKNEKAIEEVGERYFDELLSRSLFQRPRLDRPSFTMHDLINDLAMFVSRKFCFRLDQKNSHEVPERVCHLSYMSEEFDISSKFEPLKGVKCLRIFFPVSLAPFGSEYPGYVSNKVLDDLLPAQKYLRAFSLSRYKNITHLPDSIGNHIHLRYIDLSYTTIKRLPDTMCTLYNLQTLLLKGCSSLVELPADMRKLIHLRHLDIGGTCIKKMPVHMGRLKSLRTLTAFVLGKSTGSSIAELRELSHLGGKISILNLQNVVGAIDASLKDKKDLSEVVLSWGPEVSDESVKERHVLERLQPSVNLVKLTIRCYGGISFPNWVGDSSFSNLQVLSLSDCSNCSSLPPVGQLPALKELCVERMKVVTSVGVELYGGNQPFQCLEKLEFSEMPEWEEWQPSPSGGESPDFPRLKELRLSWCPKLRGNLPTHLPSLKTLDVSKCEVLYENRDSNTLNAESLRGSLEKLAINECPGLSLLLESTEMLPSLLKLGIDSVGEKEWLPQMVHNSNRLQHLSLSKCSSLLSFPANGLPTTLTSLRIFGCKKLEFLSREMMAKLTSLQSLDLIMSCDSLRSFPLGIFPNLSSLFLFNCENLESLSVEGGADENLSHLNSLYIFQCPNLVSFPDGGLPTPNLTSFEVRYCKNLKLLPDRMHTLTALQELSIYRLPNVVSFAQGGLPPNLQSLSIDNCERLRPSVEWRLQGLASLQRFLIIEGSKDLVEALLNEQLLPATLHTLWISGVSNLKSLDGKGLEHLTSLQHLHIERCESLKILPKEGLPASLSSLTITDCPSLKKRYRNKKGKDWRNIARIPCIHIDREVNIL